METQWWALLPNINTMADIITKQQNDIVTKQQHKDKHCYQAAK